MRLRLAFSCGALLLATALPAAAQDYAHPEFSRRIFSYLGPDLTIDVRVTSSGTLRISRGGGGQVEVAARARNGFAGFGLGGARDQLQLTAVGSDHVDYLVIVPKEVRVRVRLPDRDVSEVFGSMRAAASYSWQATAEAPAGMPERVGVVGPSRDEAETEYTGAVPRSLSVPNARGVRTLTVRWEGSDFAVRSNRRIAVAPSADGVLNILAADQKQDLVVILPARVTDFVLRVGEAQALVLRNGEVASKCAPVAEQTLSAERRWFTFTPDDGELNCRRAVGTPKRTG